MSSSSSVLDTSFERVVMRGGARANLFTGFVPGRLQKADFKPVGLWYGIDDSWLNWCEQEMPGWVGDSFYKLDVDIKRMLVLQPDQLDEFTEEYGVPPPWPSPEGGSPRFCYIDWMRVSERWSGIEIPVYSYGHRMDLMWYYGWDVACGVIWDQRALLGYSKIKAPRRAHG